jgi:hypothetical protein
MPAASPATPPASREKPCLLLFGGGGAIGQGIRDKFAGDGWRVIVTGRHASPNGKNDPDWLVLDPFAPGFDGAAFAQHGPFAAVCWAQGANLNDTAQNADVEKHMELYRANCLFVVVTLQKLLAQKKLMPGARLCVISSIWQDIARPGKFSYCVTKSALRGLVQAAAADLAPDGYLINAVLPGAVDTPMTRKVLTPAQIESFASATPFKRLPALADVANLAFYLCSPQNTGLTGQCIAADLGFSRVRIL